MRKFFFATSIVLAGTVPFGVAAALQFTNWDTTNTAAPAQTQSQTSATKYTSKSTPVGTPATCQGNICCDATILAQVGGSPEEIYSEPPTFSRCQDISQSTGIKTTAQQVKDCLQTKTAGQGSLYSLAGTYTYTDMIGQKHTGNRCDEQHDGVPMLTSSQLLNGASIEQPTSNLNTKPIPSNIQSDIQQILTDPTQQGAADTLVKDTGMTQDQANQTIKQLSSGNADQIAAAKKALSDQLTASQHYDQTQVGSLLETAPPTYDAQASGKGVVGGDNPEGSTQPQGNQNSNSNYSGQDSTTKSPPPAGNAPAPGTGGCGNQTSGVTDVTYFVGCGESGNVNPNPNGCTGGACGVYQIQPDTYNNYISQCIQAGQCDSTCAYADASSVACSTQILRYKAPIWQQQYGAVCSANGINSNACADTCWRFGEAGCKSVYQALSDGVPLNSPASTLCGYYLSKTACTGQRNIMNGSIADMFNRMGGGSSPAVSPFTAPPAGIAGALGGVGGIHYSGSCVAGQCYSVDANTSPVGAMFGSNSSMQSVMQMQMIMSAINSFAQQTAARLQQQQAQIQAQQTQQASQPGTASISVDPTSVKAGDKVTVKWSSSNMQSCKVYEQASGVSSLITEGASGSTPVTTYASSTPGTINFELACTDQSGNIVQKLAPVTIQ